MADFYGDPFTRTIRNDDGDEFTVTRTGGGSVPSRETVKLDNGSTVDVYRGSSSEDEELTKLQNKQYEANSLFRLQQEQAEVAERAKESFPDGRGYAQTVQEHVLNRSTEIIDGARDNEQKERLSNLLSKFVDSAVKNSAKEEASLIKQDYLKVHFESMDEIQQAVEANPAALPGLRQESADRVVDMGRTLGWDQEETAKAIEEADKELVTTSIHAIADRDVEKAYELLDTGAYSDIFNKREVQNFKDYVDSVSLRDDELETMPSSQEVIKSALNRVYGGEDIDESLREGKMNHVEHAIASDLKAIETQRMDDPVYESNKTQLMDAKPGGTNSEDSAYAQKRLQALYDNGTLNEQSVQMIHMEVKQRVTTRVNKDLKEVTRVYPGIPDTIEKIKEIGVGVLKVNLVNDYKSGKITLEEAKKARQALMNAAGAIE